MHCVGLTSACGSVWSLYFDITPFSFFCNYSITFGYQELNFTAQNVRQRHFKLICAIIRIHDVAAQHLLWTLCPHNRRRTATFNVMSFQWSCCTVMVCQSFLHLAASAMLSDHFLLSVLFRGQHWCDKTTSCTGCYHR